MKALMLSEYRLLYLLAEKPRPTEDDLFVRTWHFSKPAGTERGNNT